MVFFSVVGCRFSPVLALFKLKSTRVVDNTKVDAELFCYLEYKRILDFIEIFDIFWRVALHLSPPHKEFVFSKPKMKLSMKLNWQE